MARLISQAELSRLAGVSEAAITKACKKQLAPARVGRRIDLDHPATRQYLESKGVKPSAPPPAAAAPEEPERKRPARPLRSEPPDEQTDSEPSAEEAAAARAGKGRGVRVVTRVVDDVGSVADMTIRQVVERFGTVTAFKDWLTSLKAIEDIREKRLRNEEADGRLIPREPVKAHVFGAIDAANRRLLNDSPKTIARRVYALAKSGVVIEEAEKTVREIISSQLRPVKTQAAKVLRNV